MPPEPSHERGAQGAAPPDVLADDPVLIPEADAEVAEAQAPPEAETKVEGEGSPPQLPLEGETWTSARPAHAADPDRRRKLMPWAFAAATAVVLGASAVGMSYSPLFRADRIVVRGESRLSEARVLKVAGLGASTNLLHANLGAAERRLEANPWIASASVTRQLPHGLQITVVERTAVAVADDGAGPPVLVSAQGTPLGPVPAGTALPAVTTTDGTSPPDPAAMRTGAAVAAAMPPGLLSRAASITVGADGSIWVETDTHVMARYGDDTQLAAKGQALKAVLDYAANEGKVISEIDVTVPGAPTGRLAGAPVGEQITFHPKAG